MHMVEIFIHIHHIIQIIPVLTERCQNVIYCLLAVMITGHISMQLGGYILACCKVKETGPICMAFVCCALSSDLNHMALVIIVMNSKDIQHEMRCTRVKLLLVGRENTENHKWSLVSFFLIDEENRCLKAARSSRPATGIILSIMPSSSSTAIHRSHRKKYLKKIKDVTQF